MRSKTLAVLAFLACFLAACRNEVDADPEPEDDASPNDVAVAKAGLAIGYIPGDSAFSVTGNLMLPTSGGNGVSISWATDSPGTVTSNGTVTRPPVGSRDATVALTATISKNTSSDTKAFAVTVKAFPDTGHPGTADDPGAGGNPGADDGPGLINISAADVEGVRMILEIVYAPGDSESSVTANLTLPTVGANGVSIAWASDSPGIVAPNGTVTRPSADSGDSTVTLTATISKNGVSSEKPFTVTVKALPVIDTSTEDVADVKDILVIAYAPGDSESSVTANLTLPTTGANGVSIAWVSDSPGIVAPNGTVTRPSDGSGDSIVILTATISKNASSDSKTFTVTVKAMQTIPAKNHGMYVWDGTWRALAVDVPSGVTAIAVIDGVTVVQLDDRSFRQSDGVWRTAFVSAPASFTAMCRYGNAVRGTDAAGVVYRFDGAWVRETPLPIPSISLSAWGNSVASLGTDGCLYVFDGTWKKSADALPAGTVSVAQAGKTRHALTSGGELYRYDGLWLRDGRGLPSGSVGLAASGSVLYAITQE